MSKSSLKKALGELTKQQLAQMVCELYDSRREAKEYLDYWLSPNPDKALADYKEAVDKMFFYSTGKNRSQPAANDLRRHVKHFSSLVFDSEKTADLLLHIAERQFEWLTRRTSGCMQAEKAVRRALKQAADYIESAALEEQFGLRLGRLTEKVDKFYRNQPQPRRRWWRG